MPWTQVTNIKGPQGAAGATGAPGAPGVGLTWRGPWSGSTAYAINDCVQRTNQSYICTVANTGNDPASDVTHWNLMAASGGVGNEDVGSIKAWPSVTPPPSWLLSDGSGISRTLYPDLFALLGTTYGPGDGSTTFNLPDMRGRFICGQGAGVGLTSRTIGATGGEESHVLIAAEMPSHTHGMDHFHYWSAQGSHTHSLPGQTLGSGSGFQSGTGYGIVGATTAAAATPAGNTNYASQANAAWANTGSAGSDTAHNTMPPFLVLVYIIKATATGGPTAQAPIADTTQSGLLRKVSGLTTDYVGGDNTCHALPQPGGSAGFISKSAAYTLVIADSGKYILCSGTGWTLTLPIAAVNLSFNVRNDQGLVANGTITLQPQSGSLIDGAASKTLLPQQECTLLSDGVNWRTFGLKREVILGTQDITSSTASAFVLLPVGYRYFELYFDGMTPVTSAAQFAARLSMDGGNTWGTTGYYNGILFNNSGSTVAFADAENAASFWLCADTATGLNGQTKVTLYPGSASKTPTALLTSGGRATTFNICWAEVFSLYNVLGIANGFQYFASAGNIASSFLTVKGVV